MRKIFVDTNYIVSLINTRDQHHAKSREVQKQITAARFYSSEMVMAEVLNFYSEKGAHFRRGASDAVRRIFVNPEFAVYEITSDLFLDGIELYERRLDKGYSLTDCISMNIMRVKEITDVLTNDDHFTQEGFRILL